MAKHRRHCHGPTIAANIAAENESFMAKEAPRERGPSMFGKVCGLLNRGIKVFASPGFAPTNPR